MRTLERLLLWVPLASLLVAPLAWGTPPASEPSGDGTLEEATAEAPHAEAPVEATDPAASAETTEAAKPDGGRVDLTSAEDRATWVGRIRDAQQAVEEARLREDEAAVGYGRARHKRKARGEAKRAILEERQESRGAVAEAQAKLDETMQAARRAGVPPGWVREATDGSGPANRN